MNRFYRHAALAGVGARNGVLHVSIAALILAGCGSSPAVTVPAPASAQVEARTLAGTHYWVEDFKTGTGNAGSLHLELHGGAQGRPVAPSGKLHIVYGDRNAYFAGRINLQAYVRLHTTDGDLVNRNLVLTLGRKVRENGREVAYYGADMPIQMSRATTDPVSAEVAFCSSDRYGKLTWDSDSGRNYQVRFTAR